MTFYCLNISEPSWTSRKHIPILIQPETEQNEARPYMNNLNKYLITHSKNIQTQHWTEFFDSIRQDHQLFAITVVFKPIDRNNSRERWETEYAAGVLGKFRRAIEPNPTNQDSALPFPDFYFFERFESSGLRTAGRRSPFHIHSLLPIRKSQLHRIWSFDNNSLTDRLLKDIQSLKPVQSILVEPIPEGCTVEWVRYITKQKQI